MDKSKVFKLLAESCGCVNSEDKQPKIKYNKVEALFDKNDSYDFKIIRAFIKEGYSGGVDATFKIIGPYKDSLDLFNCYGDKKRSTEKLAQLKQLKEHIDNFITALEKEIKS